MTKLIDTFTEEEDQIVRDLWPDHVSAALKLERFPTILVYQRGRHKLKLPVKPKVKKPKRVVEKYDFSKGTNGGPFNNSIRRIY